MKSCKKHLLVLISLICFIGCSKPKETELGFVDMKTVIPRMPLANRIVCNEFDAAYYEFRTTHNHFVYSPVYKHYSTGGSYVLSCDDYDDYINSLAKRNRNETMSR